MLEKWDTLVAVLGCVAIIAAITCVAHYGRELSAAQAPPAPAAAADERGGGSAPPSKPMSGGGLDDGRDAFLLTLARDSDVIAHGEEQYRMFCAACHGEGDIGDDSPSNLFNNRWLHGSAPTAIEHLIREGFLNAGMPGWDGMIPDESIEAMVAYLLASQEEA